eukprot:Clim_evm6s157 gene=Clim_evmTU6s157
MGDSPQALVGKESRTSPSGRTPMQEGRPVSPRNGDHWGSGSPTSGDTAYRKPGFLQIKQTSLTGPLGMNPFAGPGNLGQSSFDGRQSAGNSRRYGHPGGNSVGGLGFSGAVTILSKGYCSYRYVNNAVTLASSNHSYLQQLAMRRRQSEAGISEMSARGSSVTQRQWLPGQLIVHSRGMLIQPGVMRPSLSINDDESALLDALMSPRTAVNGGGSAVGVEGRKSPNVGAGSPQLEKLQTSLRSTGSQDCNQPMVDVADEFFNTHLASTNDIAIDTRDPWSYTVSSFGSGECDDGDANEYYQITVYLAHQYNYQFVFDDEEEFQAVHEGIERLLQVDAERTLQVSLEKVLRAHDRNFSAALSRILRQFRAHVPGALGEYRELLQSIIDDDTKLSYGEKYRSTGNIRGSSPLFTKEPENEAFQPSLSEESEADPTPQRGLSDSRLILAREENLKSNSELTQSAENLSLTPTKLLTHGAQSTPLLSQGAKSGSKLGRHPPLDSRNQLGAENSAAIRPDWEIQSDDLQVGTKISEGFFGTVHEGLLYGKKVAVKRIKPSAATEEVLDDLLTEISTMAELRHPNVLLFMGAVIRPPEVSIVTEYMARGTVYSVLHDVDALSDDLLVHIVRSVAEGMHYLHRRGLVHLDLKPANLLVDSSLNVKVADFGLSYKPMPGTAVDQGAAIGAPRGTTLYMAPEVLYQTAVGAKADVFSFGVTLYEFLYVWDDPATDFVVDDEPGFEQVREPLHRDRPVKFPPWWNDVMVGICQRCLNNRAEERPSFGEVIDRIRLGIPKGSGSTVGHSLSRGAAGRTPYRGSTFTSKLQQGQLETLVNSEDLYFLRRVSAMRLYTIALMYALEALSAEKLSTLQEPAGAGNRLVRMYSLHTTPDQGASEKDHIMGRATADTVDSPQPHQPKPTMPAVTKAPDLEDSLSRWTMNRGDFSMQLYADTGDKVTSTTSGSTLRVARHSSDYLPTVSAFEEGNLSPDNVSPHIDHMAPGHMATDQLAESFLQGEISQAEHAFQHYEDHTDPWRTNPATEDPAQSSASKAAQMENSAGDESALRASLALASNSGLLNKPVEHLLTGTAMPGGAGPYSTRLKALMHDSARPLDTPYGSLVPVLRQISNFSCVERVSSYPEIAYLGPGVVTALCTAMRCECPVTMFFAAGAASMLHAAEVSGLNEVPPPPRYISPDRITHLTDPHVLELIGDAYEESLDDHNFVKALIDEEEYGEPYLLPLLRLQSIDSISRQIANALRSILTLSRKGRDLIGRHAGKRVLFELEMGPRRMTTAAANAAPYMNHHLSQRGEVNLQRHHAPPQRDQQERMVPAGAGGGPTTGVGEGQSPPKDYMVQSPAGTGTSKQSHRRAESGGMHTTLRMTTDTSDSAPSSPEPLVVNQISPAPRTMASGRLTEHPSQDSSRTRTPSPVRMPHRSSLQSQSTDLGDYAGIQSAAVVLEHVPIVREASKASSHGGRNAVDTSQPRASAPVEISPIPTELTEDGSQHQEDTTARPRALSTFEDSSGTNRQRISGTHADPPQEQNDNQHQFTDVGRPNELHTGTSIDQKAPLKLQKQKTLDLTGLVSDRTRRYENLDKDTSQATRKSVEAGASLPETPQTIPNSSSQENGHTSP